MKKWIIRLLGMKFIFLLYFLAAIKSSNAIKSSFYSFFLVGHNILPGSEEQ